MYKELIFDVHGEQTKHVIRDNGNGSFTSFPFDPANTDYQEYLAWLSSGNVPLPADEVAGTLTPTQENLNAA